MAAFCTNKPPSVPSDFPVKFRRLHKGSNITTNIQPPNTLSCEISDDSYSARCGKTPFTTGFLTFNPKKAAQK
jgi:hypothetical protein